MENHALPSLSLSPWLGIRSVVGGQKEVSLVSAVTQGE